MTHHHAKKRFGQHFLRDPHILAACFNAIAPTANDHLIEIGPGQGALTEYLVHQAGHFDVIELDRDLIPMLTQRFGTAMTIHAQDVLTVDFTSLRHTRPLRVVGNLPYNISTPLLFHLFDQIHCIQDMHFLLQKEVVDRLCATVGSPHYGRLSVMTQCYCQAIRLHAVPANAFSPPPKVESTFVRLVPHHAQPLADNTLTTTLTQVVREAFNYRRKTISNSLKRLITANALSELEIDPQSRPQMLTTEDYLRLAAALAKKSNEQ